VPPTHTPAAATQGRNLTVNRFFTETSRGKGKATVPRNTCSGAARRPSPVGGLPEGGSPAEPPATKHHPGGPVL
ncbi:MAG: hypothetical protein ACK55I_51020, partial [bacterium]